MPGKVTYGSESGDPAADERYAELLAQERTRRSAGFLSLQEYMRNEGVPLEMMTGNVNDIVLHSHRVGTFIMNRVQDEPGTRIEPGALRIQMGNLAELRETDVAAYKEQRSKSQAMLREVEASEQVPEIALARRLDVESEGHVLQPLVRHALFAMGLVLDTKRGRKRVVTKPDTKSA